MPKKSSLQAACLKPVFYIIQSEMTGDLHFWLNYLVLWFLNISKLEASFYFGVILVDLHSWNLSKIFNENHIIKKNLSSVTTINDFPSWLLFFFFCYCCILAFDPAKNAIPRWCTGRRGHILIAVMRGNRVGGNWLMKWDEVKKFPWYTHRLMHRKRVTCELHDSYFRWMTINPAIPKIE